MSLAEPLFKVGWLGERVVRDVACSIVDSDLTGEVFVFRCTGGAGQGRYDSALFLRVGDGYEMLAVQTAETKKQIWNSGTCHKPKSWLINAMQRALGRAPFVIGYPDRN